ncbi:MAG: Rpn family recombination-promoting nuclease/putative transposase [Bacteroidota bacterium]
MRFVDVKNDVAFRKIFGNEKKTEIIISFLNAVLLLEGDKRIEEVVFVNPYLLPRIAGEKASIIDVRAKDLKGRQFVIEMQMADVNGFAKRVQYYTCRDYSMQIQSGEKYSLLKPTYFIGILDFNFFDGSDYLSHHIILNEKTYEHKLKDLKFTFIELRKFHKEIDELDTPVEKWTFFIKNAKNLDVIPENTTDEGLIEAYRRAERYRWDKEELRDYDNAAIAIQDARGRIEAAEQKAEERGMKRGMERGMKRGMERGIEQGMEQGVQQGLKLVVTRSYAQGMSIEAITVITGLSTAEVHRIIATIE